MHFYLDLSWRSHVSSSYFRKTKLRSRNGEKCIGNTVLKYWKRTMSYYINDMVKLSSSCKSLDRAWLLPLTKTNTSFNLSCKPKMLSNVKSSHIIVKTEDLYTCPKETNFKLCTWLLYQIYIYIFYIIIIYYYYYYHYVS